MATIWAPLLEPVQALLAAGLELHCLRDLTRGGLASAIDEIARAAGCCVVLEEEAIPVHPAVDGACQLLGLDPLGLANEGRMVVLLPADQADDALATLRHFQAEATWIGTVEAPIGQAGVLERRHPVHLRGALGVLRPLEPERGDQLPRIC